MLRYWTFYIFANLLNILNFNSKIAHFADSSSWQLDIVITCLLSFSCYQRMPHNTNELKSMITAKTTTWSYAQQCKNIVKLYVFPFFSTKLWRKKWRKSRFLAILWNFPNLWKSQILPVFISTYLPQSWIAITTIVRMSGLLVPLPLSVAVVPWDSDFDCNPPQLCQSHSAVFVTH